MFTGSAHGALIQHLDAAAAASVMNNPVAQWMDQSGFGNHAIADAGSVYYPSTSLSASGDSGLGFGPHRNRLVLFSGADSVSWLDQSAGTGGFCLLAVFKCDEINR